MQSVSRETSDSLKLYVSEVLKWNPRINLISKNSADDIWMRHIEDSLQLLEHFPSKARVFVDLGSGGGFPAIPCAIRCSDKEFHLIESDQRKAVFLQHIARSLCPNVHVHSNRIEAADVPKADVVSARALAEISKLLDLAYPILKEDTLCIFPKGKTHAAELEAAQKNWSFSLQVVPSRTNPDAVLYLIREPQRVGSTKLRSNESDRDR